MYRYKLLSFFENFAKHKVACEVHLMGKWASAIVNLAQDNNMSLGKARKEVGEFEEWIEANNIPLF